MKSVKKLKDAADQITNYLKEELQNLRKENEKYAKKIELLCEKHFSLGQPFDIDKMLNNCDIKNYKYDPKKGPYDLFSLTVENQKIFLEKCVQYRKIYLQYYQLAERNNKASANPLKIKNDHAKVLQQEIDAKRQKKKLSNGWHSALQLADWWATPAWWDSLQDENGKFKADGKLQKYALVQAGYVAYPSKALAKAFDYLVEFLGFIKDAIADVHSNKSTVKKLYDEIEKGLTAAKETIKKINSGKPEDHEENNILKGKVKFLEGYLEYLTLFRENLILHFNSILEVMFQRLHLMDEHNLTQESFILNIFSRIIHGMNVKSSYEMEENKLLNLLKLYGELNEESSQYFIPDFEELSPELYKHFYFNILKHGKRYLKNCLRDSLRLFNPSGIYQGLHLELAYIKNKLEFVIPNYDGVDTLISSLEQTIPAHSLYQPDFASIFKYQSCKQRLVKRLGELSPPTKSQSPTDNFQLNLIDIKDDSTIINLLENTTNLLSSLCINWSSYEKNSVEAIKNKTVRTILDAWGSDLQKELRHLVLWQKNLLETLEITLEGQLSEKIKLIYSNEMVVQALITNLCHLLNAWRNLKASPEEKQIVEACSFLEAIRAQLVQMIKWGLINPIEKSTLILLINFAELCRTGTLNNNNPFLQLLCIENADFIEQISMHNFREAINFFAPECSEKDELLKRAIRYAALTTPNCHIVPLLEESDRLLNTKNKKIWDEKHHPLIADYKSKIVIIFRDKVFIDNRAIKELLFFLNALEALCQPKVYMENLKKISQSFWSKYKGNNNEWHEVVSHIPFEDAQANYFMTRIRYLLSNAGEDFLWEELEQIKNWQGRVNYRPLSDLVEKALTDPKLQIWAFPELWLQFLDAEAKERCNRYWDNYFYAKIKDSLQETSQAQVAYDFVINNLEILHPFFPATFEYKLQLANYAQELCQQPWNKKTHSMIEHSFPLFDKQCYRYHWLECFLKKDKPNALLKQELKAHRNQLRLLKKKSSLDESSVLKEFFGMQDGFHNGEYTLYTMVGEPITVEKIKEQNITKTAIIISRIKHSTQKIIVVFVEDRKPLQIAEDCFREFHVSLTQECFEFIKEYSGNRKNPSCIEKNDANKVILGEIIRASTSQIGLARVFKLIKNWLENPNYHPYALDLLTDYFKEYGQLQFFEDTNSYTGLEDWSMDGKRLVSLFKQEKFQAIWDDIILRRIIEIDQAHEEFQKKLYARFRGFLLTPLIEYIKRLLANAAPDTNKSNLAVKELKKLLDILLSEDNDSGLSQQTAQLKLMEDLLLILSSASAIADLHRDLMKRMQIRSDWPVFWKEPQLTLVLKGFPEHSLQELRAILLQMSTANMSKKTRYIWRMLHQYLDTSPIRRENKTIEELVNSLQEWNKEHLNKHRSVRCVAWKTALTYLVVEYKGKMDEKNKLNLMSVPSGQWHPDLHKALYEDDFRLKFDPISSSTGVNHKVKKLDISYDPSKIDLSKLGSVYIKSLYIKVEPDSPGAALLWDAFCRFFDPDLPHVEVIKFSYKDDDGTLLKRPALISEAVEGQTLSEVWLKGLKLNLNRKAFSQQFLLALLLKPADQKPENIIVRRYREVESGEEYELVPIDNDQFGVPPFYTKIKYPTKPQNSIKNAIYPICENNTIKETRLGIKTVLFCMDEMYEPLDPEILSQWQSLDVDRLLDMWLQEAQKINQQLLQIFTEKERQEFYKLPLPIELLAQVEDTLFPTLYDNLLRMQDYINLNKAAEKITHFDLLKQIYPPLAAHYEKSLEKDIPPSKRFYEATHKYYEVSLNKIACPYNLQFSNINEKLNIQTMSKNMAYIEKSQSTKSLVYVLKKNDGSIAKGEIKTDELPAGFFDLLIDNKNTNEINKIINTAIEKQGYGYIMNSYGYTTSHPMSEIVHARSVDAVDEETWKNKPKISMLQANDKWHSIKAQRKKISDCRKELLQLSKEKFSTLEIPLFKEKVIDGLDFRHLTSDQQEFIVKEISNISFQSLNLRYCTALQWKDLKKILENSRFLKKLDVSYCSKLQLDTSEMREIAYLCPHLTELSLIAIGFLSKNALSKIFIIDTIKSFFGHSIESTSPALKKLNLSNNNNLQEILIDARDLVSLRASDCPQLTTIVLSEARLQHLDIRNSPLKRLEIGESLFTLSRFQLKNELNTSFQRLSQQFPFLLPFGFISSDKSLLSSNFPRFQFTEEKAAAFCDVVEKILLKRHIYQMKDKKDILYTILPYLLCYTIVHDFDSMINCSVKEGKIASESLLEDGKKALAILCLILPDTHNFKSLMYSKSGCDVVLDPVNFFPAIIQNMLLQIKSDKSLLELTSKIFIDSEKSLKQHHLDMDGKVLQSLADKLELIIDNIQSLPLNKFLVSEKNTPSEKGKSTLKDNAQQKDKAVLQENNNLFVHSPQKQSFFPPDPNQPQKPFFNSNNANIIPSSDSENKENINDEWAGGFGINYVLNKYLSNIAHIIDPEASSISNPLTSKEGVRNYIQCISGYYAQDGTYIKNGLIHQKGELTMPIVMVMNTVPVKVIDPKNGKASGGKHWVTCVILPKKFTVLGQTVSHPTEQIYFIDSINKGRCLPDDFKTALKNGMQVIGARSPDAAELQKDPALKEIPISYNIPPAFPQAEFYDLNIPQQEGGSDCGWWAVYNAIMFVITGDKKFTEIFTKRQRIPQLRTLFPELICENQIQVDNIASPSSLRALSIELEKFNKTFDYSASALSNN